MAVWVKLPLAVFLEKCEIFCNASPSSADGSSVTRICMPHTSRGGGRGVYRGALCRGAIVQEMQKLEDGTSSFAAPRMSGEMLHLKRVRRDDPQSPGE